MANKTNFTPDEWTKLLESPMMAGLAITAAEPSGLWGLLKESLSSGWALLEAKTSGPNELIKAIATDFGTREGRGAGKAVGQQALRDPGQGHWRASGSRGDCGCEGPGRGARIQGLVEAGRPEDSRGFDRGRLSGLWRGAGQRGREGDPGRDIKRVRSTDELHPRRDGYYR